MLLHNFLTTGIKLSPKDTVFSQKRSEILPFKFDQNVANVFDDMVSRSVPFYNEIHRILTDLLSRTYPNQEGAIYDLGCSTGSTLVIIGEFFKSSEKEVPCMYGVDNSKAMLEKCREKIQDKEYQKKVELLLEDIEKVEFKKSNLIIMNYTLQFLPKDAREKIIRKIYQALNPGGLFMLSEKIVTNNTHMNDLLIDLYYDFKRRNGYSELEISQKREALENVLVPITPKEQIIQLEEAGFENVEMIFKWYNFASYLGIKK